VLDCWYHLLVGRVYVGIQACSQSLPGQHSEDAQGYKNHLPPASHPCSPPRLPYLEFHSTEKCATTQKYLAKAPAKTDLTIAIEGLNYVMIKTFKHKFLDQCVQIELLT